MGAAADNNTSKGNQAKPKEWLYITFISDAGCQLMISPLPLKQHEESKVIPLKLYSIYL